MKKFIVSLLICFAICSSLRAQSDLYNGGQLTLSNATDTVFTKTAFVNASTGTLNINGQFVMQGNFTSRQSADFTGTGLITLSGNNSQAIKVHSAFKNLTINKPLGLVRLDTTATVAGTLSFVSGKLLTDTNTLKIASTGNIAGAAQNTGWVIGRLQKYFSAAILAKTFEVGDTLSYSPATISFASITTAGGLTTSVSAPDHAQIHYSGIDHLKSINRSWTVTNSGITFTNASATFNFLTSDKDAGTTTANFKTALYNNATGWALTSMANPLSNSIQANSLTSFGDFIIGERISSYKWTGDAFSSDWHTAKNWLGGIPTNEFDALIPAGIGAGRYYPVLTTTAGFTKKITIETAASLFINGTTLHIAGDILNSGTFNVSAGAISLNGTQNQVIPAGAFTGNKILNLAIDNNVSLAGTDTITGTLSVASGKTFTTNNNLVLKSDNNGTARIATLPTDLSGNATAFITGNVSIERYIPLRKAWRLLSAPLKSFGSPTINAAWQEGLTTASANPNLYPGYGVHIMGGTLANGFDQSPTNATSIMILNSSTGQFSALPQASTHIPITTYPGYFLYIRGNRSINLMQGLNAAITSTTLRMKGQVNTGNVVSSVNASGYTVLGNPYPSAIDFETITKTNVKNAFYIWDPKLSGGYGLGGYVTYIWNISTNSYDATSAASPLSKYIQSGEAVLVSTLNGTTTGSITFKESDKTSAGDDHVFGRTDGLDQHVRVNLYTMDIDGSRALLDGALTTYDIDNANDVDTEDAAKIIIKTENIGLMRSANVLAVERRKTIASNDTIFLHLQNLKPKVYSLDISMNKMSLTNGVVAVFKDAYGSHINNSLFDLNGNTVLEFEVNSDPASYASNRFSIQFIVQGPLPVSFKSIKATKQQADILVKWDTEVEINVRNYMLERSSDAVNFNNIFTRMAASQSGGSASYQYLDKEPLQGVNYYRVKSIDHDGSVGYSEVVKVIMDNKGSEPTIAVLQTLSTDKNFVLKAENLGAGNYTIRLFNLNGQLISQQKLSHAVHDQTHLLQLRSKLPSGKYEVELIGQGIRLRSSFIKN